MVMLVSSLRVAPQRKSSGRGRLSPGIYPSLQKKQIFLVFFIEIRLKLSFEIIILSHNYLE